VHEVKYNPPGQLYLVVGDCSEYDVIAVQEPARSPGTGQLYCPASSKYHLIYEAAAVQHYISTNATESQDGRRLQGRTGVALCPARRKSYLNRSSGQFR
jgi:hypothetical protein